MATVINITNKIKREPKFMVYGDKSYPVNGSKNTVIEVIGLINNPEIDDVTRLDMALDLLIGKKARKEFDAMDLDLDDYRAVMTGALAAASGQSQAEFEDSFRDEAEQSNE